MSTSVTRIVCHSFPQIKLFSHNIEKSFFLEGRCEKRGFQNLSTLGVEAENVEYIAGGRHAFEVGRDFHDDKARGREEEIKCLLSQH